MFTRFPFITFCSFNKTDVRRPSTIELARTEMTLDYKVCRTGSTHPQVNNWVSFKWRQLESEAVYIKHTWPLNVSTAKTLTMSSFCKLLQTTNKFTGAKLHLQNSHNYYYCRYFMLTKFCCNNETLFIYVQVLSKIGLVFQSWFRLEHMLVLECMPFMLSNQHQCAVRHF